MFDFNDTFDVLTSNVLLFPDLHFAEFNVFTSPKLSVLRRLNFGLIDAGNLLKELLGFLFSFLLLTFFPASLLNLFHLLAKHLAE